MKLSGKLIKQMVIEELERFRSRYEAEQHMRDSQKERDNQRAKRNELYPNSLKALARGVVAESDLEVIGDDSEFVRIKKTALDRLLSLNEGQSDAQGYCNKHGYKSMQQWLQITNAFSDASKGKFGDPK